MMCHFGYTQDSWFVNTNLYQAVYYLTVCMEGVNSFAFSNEISQHSQLTTCMHKITSTDVN